MSAYEQIKNRKHVTKLDLTVIFWGEEEPETEGEPAAQELLDLRANLDAAVRFLKLLDIRENKSLFVDECPFCGWEMGHGHDCELSAFLKRMEAE